MACLFFLSPYWVPVIYQMQDSRMAIRWRPRTETGPNLRLHLEKLSQVFSRQSAGDKHGGNGFHLYSLKYMTRPGIEPTTYQSQDGL